MADGGAGLVELLAYLHARNRRFGRSRRLTEEQLDALSLHCWSLQRTNPTGLLWGRARELWGGSPRSRPGIRRRTGPAGASDEVS